MNCSYEVSSNPTMARDPVCLILCLSYASLAIYSLIDLAPCFVVPPASYSLIDLAHFRGLIFCLIGGCMVKSPTLFPSIKEFHMSRKLFTPLSMPNSFMACMACSYFYFLYTSFYAIYSSVSLAIYSHFYAIYSSASLAIYSLVLSSMFQRSIYSLVLSSMFQRLAIYSLVLSSMFQRLFQKSANFFCVFSSTSASFASR